jgi:4-aminobutyrate aminotransferase-like enzyme
VWLADFDGKRYLDAISSWWVGLCGPANSTINAALTNQLGKLERYARGICARVGGAAIRTAVVVDRSVDWRKDRCCDRSAIPFTSYRRM